MLRENTVTWKWEHSDEKFVGNKAKRQISKRVFQRKQSTTNFPKSKHFLPPDTHTYVCVSGGGRGGGKNVRFSENLARFVFLKHLFWDSPFCLITDEFQTETSVLDFISKQKKRYKKGNPAKFIFLAWKQWKRLKEMITE